MRNMRATQGTGKGAGYFSCLISGSSMPDTEGSGKKRALLYYIDQYRLL
jgi:hypothetical protein